jgi:4-hydroxybenzoate polyprenyltransferase
MVMLRQYLLLARLPNAFTAPSNVIVGFCSVSALTMTSLIFLGPLMVVSVLLYVAGIILNDFFDIDVDRRERPSRPLPSGAIPKQQALKIAIFLMIVANLVAFCISISSFIVSIALTALIFGYDSWLKNTGAGAFAMGGTRFLNVFLGATPALFYGNNIGFPGWSALGTLFAAASVFTYVFAISNLARIEVDGRNARFIFKISFSIIFALVSILLCGGILIFNHFFIINLVLFSTIMVIVFMKGMFFKNIINDVNKQSIDIKNDNDFINKNRARVALDTVSIQYAVKILVLSIIILDSVFVTGFAGPLTGLLTMILILPSFIAARKLYVT